MAVRQADISWRLAGCSDLCFPRNHHPVSHELYGRLLEQRDQLVHQRTVASNPAVLVTGRLRLDMQAHSVAVDGEHVDLTPTEHRLLLGLAQQVGKTVAVRGLLAETWMGDLKDRRLSESHRHMVRVVVARLRKKLRAAGTLIRTQVEVGYRLEMVGIGETLPAAPRNPGWNHRITTWAMDWDRCRDCGTTERPHKCHGRCTRCDPRQRQGQL